MPNGQIAQLRGHWANNQGVAWLHEVEQHLQLGSPVAAGTAGLLCTNDTAAGRLEGPHAGS